MEFNISDLLLPLLQPPPSETEQKVQVWCVAVMSSSYLWQKFKTITYHQRWEVETEWNMLMAMKRPQIIPKSNFPLRPDSPRMILNNFRKILYFFLTLSLKISGHNMQQTLDCRLIAVKFMKCCRSLSLGSDVQESKIPTQTSTTTGRLYSCITSSSNVWDGKNVKFQHKMPQISNLNVVYARPSTLSTVHSTDTPKNGKGQEWKHLINCYDRS